MRLSLVLLVSMLCLSGNAYAKAKNWSWELPSSRYKQMNTFQRALYSKGKAALEKKQYRQAATAFEKFKVEHEESPLLSYVLFMYGYSQHQAKDRNGAIRTYTEVLDYFGDIIEDAAPALYYMGRAHFDNGDRKKGMMVMKEMAEDEDYSKHPLAAGALRILADNDWANKERSTAVRYWKQVVRDFAKTNPDEAENARRRIYIYYLEEGNLSGALTWEMKMNPLAGKAQIAQRVEYVNTIAAVAFRHIQRSNGYRKASYAKHKKKHIANLLAFAQAGEQAFMEAQRAGEFYLLVLPLIGAFDAKSKDFMSYMDLAQLYSRKLSEGEKRDRYLIKLASLLRDQRQVDHGIHLLHSLSDKINGAYLIAKFLQSSKQYEKALAQFQAVEKMGKAAIATSSKKERASILHKNLKRYDEAIALYTELNSPPSTLWGIADCHAAKGSHQKAITTWLEIENSFPSDASRAAWARANHYKKIGDDKKAISESRGILKRYPKSRESSKAHQLLEGFGINTGGGLID